MSADGLRAALAEAIGDETRVSTGESERDLHAEDITFHRPRRPDVVVYARTTVEVSAVLALAESWRVPVTPFGSTVAVRFSGVIPRIRSIRVRSSEIPPATGITWPSRLVPAPNGVTGTRQDSARASTAETSTVVRA